MDFHLKQWRNQQYESEQYQQQQQKQEEQHSAKIPKLLVDHHQPHQIKPETSPVSSAALPLFVTDHQPPNNNNNNNRITTTHLSVAFPHQSTTPVSSSRHPRGMGNYFSLAQRQELELQALIFRYMLAGAAVPSELLQPIKKSFNNLLHNPPYFLHHHPALQPYNPHHVQPHAALFQTGYWGRGAMDPEPGRCRRTDGKKWRCSRDVVVGQKYCERHMHRGRNRSRKPVERPTPAAAVGRVAGAGAGCGATLSAGFAASIGASPLGTAASGGTHFALSGPSSSIDLLQLNRSSSDVERESKELFKPHNEVSGDCKSGGQILRHFFDDWPKSLQEPDNASGMSSSNTSLSISAPQNLSSDVSLKLSTGDGDEPAAQQDGHVGGDHHQHLGWASGWGSSPMASMGGPLAEALRSSNSNSSPTSVLHQLPRASASETCIASS